MWGLYASPPPVAMAVVGWFLCFPAFFFWKKGFFFSICNLRRKKKFTRLTPKKKSIEKKRDLRQKKSYTPYAKKNRELRLFPQSRYAFLSGGAQGLDGQYNAWRSGAPRPHAHRNSARQVVDNRRAAEVRGPQKPSNNPCNNQHHLGTHKRHPPQPARMPAQPQHTNHWAPRTRKRHHQEHRLQRPTKCSNPTQHAKGRTGDCPGPRKDTATQRNVTGGTPTPSHSIMGVCWRRGGCWTNKNFDSLNKEGLHCSWGCLTASTCAHHLCHAATLHKRDVTPTHVQTIYCTPLQKNEAPLGA